VTIAAVAAPTGNGASSFLVVAILVIVIALIVVARMRRVRRGRIANNPNTRTPGWGEPGYSPAVPSTNRTMTPPGYEPAEPLANRTPLGEYNTRIIPQDVRIAVAARDLGRCRQCGSIEDLQYDHVIPWSRGGANTVNNVQLLCGNCNRRKGARLLPRLRRAYQSCRGRYQTLPQPGV
jgi:HNH endonuclease